MRKVSGSYNRNPALANISVWDFVAQVQKVKKSAISAEYSTDDDTTALHLIQSSIADANIDLLAISSRHRPSFPFMDTHIESDDKVSKIIHPHKRMVPVPIGPSIPRRDCQELYHRYCRLMLILFKPWRSVVDLRIPGQSWIDAFTMFQSSISSAHAHVIENMQILHECKDSRDDHFRSRTHRIPHVSTSSSSVSMEDDPNSQSMDVDEMLEHLQSLDTVFSRHTEQGNLSIVECLHSAELLMTTTKNVPQSTLAYQGTET